MFPNFCKLLNIPTISGHLWKGPVFGFHSTKPHHQSKGRIFYFATSGITVFVPVPLIDAKRAPLVTLFLSKKGLIYSSSILLASEHSSILQKLNNHMVNVLAEFFVSFSCQVKVIKHVLMAYDAITPYKAWIRDQVN